MKRKLSEELREALEKVLAAAPGRIWTIGALYDEVRFEIPRDYPFEALSRVVQALVAEGKLIVSWQVYAVRNYRLAAD